MSKLKQFFEKLVENLTKKNHRSVRRTALSTFALVIALCTVYALILPGITATANVYPLNEDTDITNVKLQIMPSGSSKWQTVGATTESLTVGLNDKLQFQLNYKLASGTLSSQRDTISYQLPVVFSSVTVVEDAPVIDNGAIIGTYSITQDGLVTITFNPDMVTKNAGVPIVGAFMFNCKVSDVIGTGGMQTITIGEWSIDLTTGGGGGGGDETSQHETEPTEPPKPQNEDLKVSKTHNVIDSPNGVVDCTVIIEADKATDTAPLIYDWMPTGFTYLQGFEIHEVTLNTDGTINTVGNTVAGTTVKDGAETLVVGKKDFYFQCAAPMAKDAVYAITYRGKVIDPFSGSYHTNNQVKVTTQIEGKNAESQYKDDIWLYNDNFVTKKGMFKVDGSGNGYIEWTITVHRPANSVLDGWVLSDVLEGYDYTGTATMKIGNGEPTTINFPYTFPSGSTGSAPETYTFTYTSPYAPKIGETGVVNSVTYRPGDYTGDNPIVITETIGMDENNPLTKTVEGLTIDTTDASAPLAVVDWNVDITPTISAILGTSGYDWLYDDTLHDGQYLTPEQAAELEATIVAEMTTKRGLERGTPNDNPNAAYNPAVQKDYTFQMKRSSSTALPSGCYDLFTLHVYVDLNKDDQINFNYSSTGPAGDLDQEHSYENRGKVMQNAPGNHVYTVESWVSAKYRPALLKTDPIPPSGTNKASSNPLTTHEYFEVDGTLEWNLAVCIPDGITTPVTVVDTLPAGVTFDSLVLQVNKKTNYSYDVVWDDASKTSGTIAVSTHGNATVTRSGQTLTVVFDDNVAEYYAGKSDTLDLRVKTKLNQIPSYEGDDNAPRFLNTAAVKVPTATPDVMKTLGEDEQAQRITVDKYHGVLNKTVVQSSVDKLTGSIPYHIEINPDALDLLEGTDSLILTDTLSAYCQNKDDVSVSLNPSTLHIYNRDETKQGNKGTPLDGSQYSYSYSSDYEDHHIKDYLTIHIPDEKALVIEYTYVIHTLDSFGSQISNTVKLEGITDGEVTSGNTIEVDFTSSGAIAGLDGITLYKVDSKNYSLTLPDAKFTLYKYNGTTYEQNRVVTTNGDGKAQLTGLEEGYAYKLVETRAPENYLCDSTPYYFMMAGAQEEVAPSDFHGDLLQQGDSIYRPNVSNYSEINVVKRWQDADGSTVTHDGTVQFNLYRKIGTRDPHVYLSARIEQYTSNTSATPIIHTYGPQQYSRGDTVDFVITVPDIWHGDTDFSADHGNNLFNNGVPMTPASIDRSERDTSGNSTVTFIYTFRMDDDVNITGSFGTKQSPVSKEVILSAHPSGTTLPPPTVTTTASSSDDDYAIRFPNGGSGSLVIGGAPVESEQRFLPGTEINLILPQDVPGKHFTGWKIVKSSNKTVDVTSACLDGTVLTMPAYSVDAVAQYEEVAVAKYDVFLVLGKEGDGDPIVTWIGTADEGSTATVTANNPAAGMEFDTWTVVNNVGDEVINPDVVFTAPHSVSTDFAMPGHDVYVRPSYKAKTPYGITVTAADGGAASYHVDTDAAAGNAFAGDTVTLNVTTVPTGKLFDRWEIVSAPDGFALTNPKDPNATFEMPAGAVSLRATFRTKPNNLIMNGDFENVDGTITSSTGGFEEVEGVVVSRDGGFEWTPKGGINTIGSSWSVVDGVLVYDSTNATSNTNWLAKIDPTYNNGNGLKANTTYTLFADVETNRDAHFYVGIKEGNKDLAKIPNENGYIQFTTGDDPSLYTILIRMDKNNSGGVQFSVDNVILVEGAVTEPPSGETTYNVNIDSAMVGGTVTPSKSKAAANAEITLTAVPDDGYHFVDWNVKEHTSGNSVTVTGGKITMPADDVDVSATFEKNTYTVTVVGGTCSPTTIQIGGSVTLDLDESAIPEGKIFDRWVLSGTGSGNCITGTGWQEPNATFQLLTPGDVTLAATYKDPVYNIVTDEYTTASVSSQVATTAPTNATVTLTPTMRSGYIFDHFVVDGVEISGNTFTMPAHDVTVSAVYEQATGCTLTVNGKYLDHGSSGSQVDIPTANYSPSKVTTYDTGETATVTVDFYGFYNPTSEDDAKGYTAVTTSGGQTLTPITVETYGSQHDEYGVRLTYSIVMNQDEVLTVVTSQPDKKVPTITISGGTGGGGEEDGAYNVVVDSNIQHGTVTASPTSADEGDTVTLTVTPADGYKLGTLTVKDSSGNDVDVTNNTFTMPASDVTVTATFAPLATNAFEEIVDRVTLTFYDQLCTRYGITYHSYQALTNPTIQYVSGNAPSSWDGASTVTPTLSATVTGGKMMSLYDPTTFEQAGNEVGATDYVYKGALPALGSGTYTYRVGGKLPNGDEVWSEPYTFTANSASADPEMSFIWFSDSHYNTLSNSGVALRKVLTAADSLLPDGPDVILSGGDFTDHGDLLYYAASAVDGNEDYFAQTPFFVASGNHDRKGVSSTASHIVNVDLTSSGGKSTSTGDYYSFDYNGVHVVVLDNGDENHSNVDDKMVTWLEQDLAASNAEWTLVMMHKPIYGPVQSGASESVPDARGQLAGVFAQYGVDVVMQSHVHMYGRSYPITDTSGTVATGYTTTTETTGGFTYDVLQSPGAPIYTVMGISGATGYRTVDSTQPAYLETYASGQPYSFSAWRIDGDKLYVDAGYADASTGEIAGYYDHFAIDKSGGGGGGTTTYNVTAASGLSNGSLSVSPSSAAAGATVTVTLSPESGYELDAWNITGGITPTATGNPNVYTFPMPANDVTVSATFKSTGGGGGTNLVVNGDFSQGTTGWTSGGATFTVSDGVATFTNGNKSPENGGLYQNVTFTPGHEYTISFDVKLNVNKQVKLSFDGTNYPYTDIGNTDCATTVHYTKTFTATSGMNQVRFTGDSRNFTIDNIVLIDNDAGGGSGEEDDDDDDPEGNLLDMTASAWSGSPSISGNKMTLPTSTNVTVAQSFTTIPNHTYTVTASVNNGSNGTLTFTLSGGGTGSQAIAKWLSDHESLSIEFTATGTSTTLTITKPEQYEATITDLQVLAVPSNAASPFEDTGPGDDGPVLDLDGARGNMLGAGEGGILVDTYTITASNSWELLLENLVSTEIIDGEEVFYVYYVEEVTPASDDFVSVGYDNNDGITGGEITIVNTVSDEEPGYILPETGGGGNWPYVVSGVTLITLCLFGGVVMTRRRRNASG